LQPQEKKKNRKRENPHNTTLAKTKTKTDKTLTQIDSFFYLLNNTSYKTAEEHNTQPKTKINNKTKTTPLIPPPSPNPTHTNYKTPQKTETI
jgi:hypothetical protein